MFAFASPLATGGLDALPTTWSRSDEMRVKQRTFFVLIIVPGGAVGECRADSQWVLENSTLTYHVSDQPHDSEGIGHAARGKGQFRSRTTCRSKWT
jgi:hypothetical protein